MQQELITTIHGDISLYSRTVGMGINLITYRGGRLLSVRRLNTTEHRKLLMQEKYKGDAD